MTEGAIAPPVGLSLVADADARRARMPTNAAQQADTTQGNHRGVADQEANAAQRYTVARVMMNMADLSARRRRHGRYDEPDPKRDRHRASGRAREATIIGQQEAAIRGLWKVIAAHHIRRGTGQNAKRSRPHKAGSPEDVRSMSGRIVYTTWSVSG